MYPYIAHTQGEQVRSPIGILYFVLYPMLIIHINPQMIKKYKDDACQRPVPRQDQVHVHTTLTVVQNSLEVDQEEEIGFTFLPL